MNFEKSIDYNNFSLVLSGGGALGIAHLGVIENMLNKYIKPSEIIGTSMGAIVGACLSIGMSSQEISKLFEDFSNILKWISYKYRSNSLISSKKIEKIFVEVFGNKKLSETKIPLKVISTNLEICEKQVWCSKKHPDMLIKDALLSTMAIPGIFEEKEINGVHYGDGFLVENLGVNETEYENILAVDVLGIKSYTKEFSNSFLKTVKVVNMFEKSMRILIYNQTMTNLNNLENKKIQYIDIDTKDYQTYNFGKYKELKNIGLNYEI